MANWTARKVLFLIVLFYVLIGILGVSLVQFGYPESTLIDVTGAVFACISGILLVIVCWLALRSRARSLHKLLIAAAPALGVTNGIISVFLVSYGLNIGMLMFVYVMLGGMILVYIFAMAFPGILRTLVAGNLIGTIMGAFWFFLYESVGVIKKVNHYWMGFDIRAPTFHTADFGLTIFELVVIPIVVVVCASILGARVSNAYARRRAIVMNQSHLGFGEPPQWPPQACPTCGGSLTFIQQYRRWYCYACQDYV
jgi:hypothetical protein